MRQKNHWTKRYWHAPSAQTELDKVITQLKEKQEKLAAIEAKVNTLAWSTCLQITLRYGSEIQMDFPEIRSPLRMLCWSPETEMAFHDRPSGTGKRVVLWQNIPILLWHDWTRQYVSFTFPTNKTIIEPKRERWEDSKMIYQNCNAISQLIHPWFY